MDVLAHSLWTNLVFYKKYKNDLRDRLWAVFFGLAPDLVSFIPATLYAFFSAGGDQLIRLSSSNLWMFVWARNSYNYTHSLVIFLIVLVLVTAIRKGKVYWPMLGWALHIGIDIFSHKGFYETPFLFPFSKYRFDHGMSWSNPNFMLINYGLLISIYLFLLYFAKIKNPKKG